VSGTDETPPVAEDDFPEFAAPPQQKPDLSAEAEKERADEQKSTGAQESADEVIARLRREREERKSAE
jgi:hypothetical protein